MGPTTTANIHPTPSLTTKIYTQLKIKYMRHMKQLHKTEYHDGNLEAIKVAGMSLQPNK